MAQYMVRLPAEERTQVTERISTGRRAASVLTRARMRLTADASEGGPDWSDREMAEAVETRLSSGHRVRQGFVAEGLAAALARQRPTGRPYRTWDGAPEARLIAWTCRTPPEGRARWTLQWLADRRVEREGVDTSGREGVRTTRKKPLSSHGSRSRGCFRPQPTPRGWVPWRPCGQSTPAPTTRSGQAWVWRRRASHWGRQRAGRCPPPQGSWSGSMTHTRGTARPIGAWSARRWRGHGR